ncbi:MAG: hypothetical protein AB7E80_02870 [Hyphomicrobiaceae bacterium]
MFFHLISTFMIGVLAASVVFALNHLSRRRLPRYLMPIAAGLAMIGYNVWSEYSWFQRTAAALPDRLAVVEVGERVASPLAPWTYLIGRIERFKALDRSSVRANPKRPGFVIAQTYEVVRRGETRKESKIVDCARKQEGDIGPATTFDGDGFPTNVTWRETPSASHLVTKACAAPQQAGAATPGVAAPGVAVPSAGAGVRPATAPGDVSVPVAR